MDTNAQAHALSHHTLSEQLQSDLDRGLAQHEVVKRLRQFGHNILETQDRRSLINIFFAQFVNPLVWVLVVAAGLAFLFQEWLEGLAVIVVIFINAGIGAFMEAQAVRSMESLRKLSRTNARVIRDGRHQQLSATELVPGDVIYLEAGEMVPADCRLVEENNLSVTEAALTGESAQVSKDTTTLPLEVPLADRKNLIFKGTIATRGNAKAIVVATGKSTQLGQIAQLTQEADKEVTPLENKLNVLSRKLIGLTLILAVLVLLLGVLQGRGVYLMVETAIALAIAAIPEGLPIVATIALARGMLRLAKRQVIVKRLSAVETLGETEVIFTDKTGTLTENRLLPDTLAFDFGQAGVEFINDKLVFRDAAQVDLKKAFAFTQLRKVAALCNNASLGNDEGASTGDPLEIALLQFAAGIGQDFFKLQDHHPRVHEIPFDSDTKMMGTLHKHDQRSDYLVCIKGALEVVLEESDFVLTKEGKAPLVDRQKWIDQADSLAARGLRVLAFAYSEIDEPKEDFFQHLIFIGFIGFIDPPRTEIQGAIKTCQAAGIRVVMVTGDHPETARNIAQKIGLTHKEDALVVHGKSLKNMDEASPEDLLTWQSTNVFARVSPAQKLDLVKLYQKAGKTVGMTGDGVNDTPALKKADIGIAMGQRGTEAAKEVADLVLKDDAFTSIVMAIKQGRSIFENIRHFVVYLLSCNLSELLIVAAAFFSNLAMPLLPLQILFLNMVTDVFPAFALGVNRDIEQVMKQPVRGKNTAIISKSMWVSIVVYAISITIAVLGALLFATHKLDASEILANNFAFYTLILAQLWNVFNLPEAKIPFWSNEVTRNRYIWLALLASISIVIIAYYTPLLKEVLSLADFNLEYLGYILLFSVFPIFFIQLFKRLQLIR